MWKKSRSSSPSGASPDEALACPSCDLAHGADERFCDRCGMPLVYAGDESAELAESDAHERARKIRPEYTRGDLVRVAGGRNQVEAEMIQNLLIEEGVPSVLRRTAGFDVPDMLVAGPRDVLVPLSGAAPAHDVLLQADLAPTVAPPRAPGSEGRHAALLLAAILGMGALTALVAWAMLGFPG